MKHKSRYLQSEIQLIRAEKTIPLGSQTFSKSRTQYPVGISPLFIESASGSKVWDIDGNKYIDLVSSLASVTLGYNNRKINQAVTKQLSKGVNFSLPSVLESEVAEMICQIVPSAESVRFGKNGTDATSAAIRLSRAYTSRNRVLVCGYHGWQDWYIGSTSRNKGVPQEVSNLTSSFKYNQIENFKKVLDSGTDVACVIMEPMNMTFPQKGFLEEIREITRSMGIVLIFDETITGFRMSEGGAQEYFGITPDLSTFGKGIANGFPLSVVTGKFEIMKEMEEIFFSGTFGGELLSLAAAKVVLSKHLEKQICNQLAKTGEILAIITENIILRNGLQEVLSISGHSSWKFLNWNPTPEYTVPELKTFFMQEVFKRGLLVLGTHNISTAHSSADLKKISEVYGDVLGEMKIAIDEDKLRSKLEVVPLQPLFKVR